MPTKYTTRRLYYNDDMLARFIAKKAWGTAPSFRTLSIHEQENGYQGFLACGKSDMDARALLLVRFVPSYVSWWCALPGDEDALISLFEILPGAIQQPMWLRVPDSQIKKLRVLSDGLKNFKIHWPTGLSKCVISYDGPERSQSDGPDSGGGGTDNDTGETSPPQNTGPRGPNPTGVPVLSGKPWDL